MTLLEYTTSLQKQGIPEEKWGEMVKAWKLANTVEKFPVVDEIVTEEVAKTNGVVEVDASVTPEKVSASGGGKFPSQNKILGLKERMMGKYLEPAPNSSQEDVDKQIANLSGIVSQSVPYETAENNNILWEFNAEGQMGYWDIDAASGVKTLIEDEIKNTEAAIIFNHFKDGPSLEEYRASTANRATYSKVVKEGEEFVDNGVSTTWVVGEEGTIGYFENGEKITEDKKINKAKLALGHSNLDVEAYAKLQQQKLDGVRKEDASDKDIEIEINKEYTPPKRSKKALTIKSKIKEAEDRINSRSWVNKSKGGPEEKEIKRLRGELSKELYSGFNEDANWSNTNSLVNKTEEQVQKVILENIPGAQVLQTDVRNNIEVVVGGEKFDVDLKPFGYDAKHKTAFQLAQIKAIGANTTRRETEASIVSSVIGMTGDDTNLATTNKRLGNIGYSIEAEYADEGFFTGMFSNDIHGEPIAFTLKKEGDDDVKFENKSDLGIYLASVVTDDEISVIKDISKKASINYAAKLDIRQEYYKANLNKDKFAEKFLYADFPKVLNNILEADTSDKFSKEDKEEIASWVDGQSAFLQRGFGLDKLSTEESIEVRGSLFGLSEELQGKLQSIGYKDIIKSSLNEAYEDARNSPPMTIAEAIMDESGDGDLLKTAARFGLSNTGKAQELIKDYNGKLKTINTQLDAWMIEGFEELSSDLPDGVSLNTSSSDGAVYFKLPDRELTAEEAIQVRDAQGKLYILSQAAVNIQKDFQQDTTKVLKVINEIEGEKKGSALTGKELHDLAFKDYDWGSILRKDLNDATANMLLSIPTVFGQSELAIREQKDLNEKGKNFETTLSYEAAIEQGRKGFFALRTLTQQLPNMVVAVGSSGLGISSIGLGATFGLFSGSQKFRDLNIERDLVPMAKEQAKNIQAAYDADMISLKEYSKAMNDVNQVIAMGSMTDAQIMQSSILTAFAEGAITSLAMGSYGNAGKFLKDIRGITTKASTSTGTAASDAFLKNLTKNKFQKYVFDPGWELVKRETGEVAEEVSIEVATALGDYFTLDRKVDLSNIDDTAVAAIIAAGPMSGAGIGYSTFTLNALTDKFSDRAKENIKTRDGLQATINSTKDPVLKEMTIAALAVNMEEMSQLMLELEVDAIGLGAENQEKLIKLNFIRDTKLSEAGVTPEMTKRQVAGRVQAHKNKLIKEGKKGEADNYSLILDTNQKQIDAVKAEVDYTIVEDLLGESGKRVGESLSESNKNNYNKKTKPQKLAAIMEEIRDIAIAEQTAIAKENPSIKKIVDDKVAKAKKEGREIDPDTLYENIGKMGVSRSGEIITTAAESKELALTALSEIDPEHDLVIVETREDLLKAIPEGTDKNIIDSMLAEFDNVVEKEGFGAIIGGRYISSDETTALKNIKEGHLQQGTMVFHEFAHVADDLAMTSKELSTYAENLFTAGFTHENLEVQMAAINAVEAVAKEYRAELGFTQGEINSWFDDSGFTTVAWDEMLQSLLTSEGFAKTSATFKDEFTKVFQETLYAGEKNNKLEKKEGLKTFIKAKTGYGLDLNTPERALDYMLAHSYAFRQGKLSSIAKKKIEKSGRTLADLKDTKKSAAKFDAGDKSRLFQKSNAAFNEAADIYNFDLSLDSNGNPNFSKAEWDAIGDNAKLGIGVMVGDTWESYVAHIMKSREGVPGYDDLKNDIIQRTATSAVEGDDGVPYLVKTYNPEKGTKLTSHIYGFVGARLQGVINNTPGFGELTTSAVPDRPGGKELVGSETADSGIKRDERAKREKGEVKKIPKLTDSISLLDDDGNIVVINDAVISKIKRAIKLTYATKKFKNPVGTKGYRQELAEDIRVQLGNLYVSLMNRGVDFDNSKKLSNKQKTENYQAFIELNFKDIYDLMPSSTISDRYTFLRTPVLNEDGTVHAMSVSEVEAHNDAIDLGSKRGKRITNKYANNKAYQKMPNNPSTRRLFEDYFKAPDAKTNVRNARKLSLADVLSEESAFDLVGDVLRDEGFKKESEIQDIEKQIGRGKFSVARLSPEDFFTFDTKKELFFRALENLDSLTTPNIRKILNSIYSQDDFSKTHIDGIAKQFAELLKPYNKLEIKLPKVEFRVILEDIINQVDQNLALSALAGSDKSMSALYSDPVNLMIARQTAVEAMKSLVEEVGSLQEAIQLIAVFGKSTFNASGKVGKGYSFKNGALIKGEKSDSVRIDLFSGKEDFVKELMKKVDPNIVDLTKTHIIYTGGREVKRKYQATSNVNIGHLTGKYDRVKEAKNVAGAKAFATGFFKFLGKADLSADTRATLIGAISDGTSNAVRLAAPVWGRSSVMPYKGLKIPTGKIKADGTAEMTAAYRYEHAIPARVVIAYLYEYHVNGNKDIDIDALWSDYRVTVIPIIEMDEVLGAAGFSKIMLSDYTPGKSPWFGRYYNIFTRGRMPFSMVSYDGKEVVGENYVEYYKTKQKALVKAEAQKKVNENRVADEAIAEGSKVKKSVAKIRIFDFDDTFATTKSNVLFTMPDGSKGKITPAVFAKDAGKMEADGAVWDFSEFSKVMEGKKGPLFNVAKTIADKRGTEDLFVLTARPQDAAGPIQEFLASMGIDIPLKNITGLGNGSPQAKADWMIPKIAEGYNDFYFADDHMGNVKAVKDLLNTFDVKSKVQLARQAKFSVAKLDKDFNDMIDRNKGIASEAEFSKVVARRRGASIGRWKLWMPTTLDDFKGLTSYVFAGKGRQGDADQAFFQDALITPYFRGVAAIETARQTAKNDFKALNKMFKPVLKKLGKLVASGDYTYDQAIRVFLWDKAGFEVPGLSKRDKAKLIGLVANDADLSAYADGALLLSKNKEWSKPTAYWDAETLLSDLNNMTEKSARKEYIAEFITNADIIFSEKNLNKIEGVYGTRQREALEDILYRMKNGTNRPSGLNKNENRFNNWVNNSVGAIMFFNRRSAVLQLLSTVNFINWSDNNPAKAALAFANQKQYWKDFATIFNSDKLKQRRSGLKGDVQEAEIASAVKGSKNKAVAALSWLLKIGFTPTQIADSFAIASGGATFYRNRINTLLKQGMTKAEAEAQAWEDFSAISEETQQSGDPALISSDQASTLGRLVLTFMNTPIQLNRSIKKASLDIYHRRRTKGMTQAQSDFSNMSKIIYYGAVQNIIFTTLQGAMFALIPGFDDEEETPEALAKKKEGKIARMVSSMISTTLKGGFGIPGAIVDTIKNITLEYYKQKEKGYMADHTYTLLQAANLAPPIGSKLSKGYKAIQTSKFDAAAIEQRGWDVTIDGRFNLSPQYSVLGNVVEGTTNLPTARAVQELNSITEALDSRNNHWQQLALGLGWKGWEVGARNEEHDLIKTEAKEEKKVLKAKEAKIKRAEEKEEEKIRLMNLSKEELAEEAQVKSDNKKEKKLERERLKEKYDPDYTPPVEKEVVPKKVKATKKVVVTKPTPKKLTPEEVLVKRKKVVKDMTKGEQVTILLNSGLSKKEIRGLQYETDRVEAIIKIRNKKKSVEQKLREQNK